MLDKVSRLCRKELRKSRRDVPRSVEVTNLNSLLQDIYLRYIALDDEDFSLYYRVVQEIFLQMHRAMKETDRLYKKNSSRVSPYAGSHADRLRIGKPDEFDIDIVIGLPLSIKKDPENPAESDFIIEPQDPGFVQLKMGVQYQRLPKRDRSKDRQDNAAVYQWGDKNHYLTRTGFMNWFKGVVDKALNQFKYDENSLPVFVVDDEEYTVGKSESGPAITLCVKGRDGFKLDVDLVPALRFPVDRWPISSEYRPIPKWWRRYPPRRPHNPHSNSLYYPNTLQRSTAHSYVDPSSTSQIRAPPPQADQYMVVPKPNQKARNPNVKNRSWRLAMQDQERMLMHNTNNMRQAIRFIKQLRDAQGMTHIASYYIKTMFFWEAMEHNVDREFWDQSPAFLFKYMLKKFKKYLVKEYLPHFWNRGDNLLDGIPSSILEGYAKKVKNLLEVLEEPSEYKRVAEFLLTKEEYHEYSSVLYYDCSSSSE